MEGKKNTGVCFFFPILYVSYVDSRSRWVLWAILASAKFESVVQKRSCDDLSTSAVWIIRGAALSGEQSEHLSAFILILADIWKTLAFHSAVLSIPSLQPLYR